MKPTWEMVGTWAFGTNRVSEIAQAAFEWGLPGQGKNAAEIRQLVLLHVTEQTLANGLQVEATLPGTLEQTIVTYFTPPARQQPQQAAASTPSAQAALPAATNHTASDPQGNAHPVQKNAFQRFLHPDPRTPEDEKLSGWELFKKYR